MKKLELTKRDYHGRNVKQRIQKIIDDTRECRKKIKLQSVTVEDKQFKCIQNVTI